MVLFLILNEYSINGTPAALFPYLLSDIGSSAFSICVEIEEIFRDWYPSILM